MRKSILAVLSGAAALLCACSTFDSPETEAKFRSIHFFAEGDPVRTLAYTAKYEEKDRAPITCQVFADQDGKFLRIYSDGRQSYRYLVVGSRGWVVEPNGTVVPMRKDILRIIRLTAYSILEPYRVIDYVEACPEPGSFRLQLDSRVRAGMVEYATLTIDPATRLPASLTTRMANGVDMVTEFSDYRKTGSLDFPHKLTIRQNGVETVCTVTDLVVNPIIPDSVFELRSRTAPAPAETQAVQSEAAQDQKQPQAQAAQ